MVVDWPVACRRDLGFELNRGINGLAFNCAVPPETSVPETGRFGDFDISDNASACLLQWLFEVKQVGFPALAYLENGTCRPVNRKRF